MSYLGLNSDRCRTVVCDLNGIMQMYQKFNRMLS